MTRLKMIFFSHIQHNAQSVSTMEVNKDHENECVVDINLFENYFIFDQMKVIRLQNDKKAKLLINYYNITNPI